ncbi:MAG: hypothetical protein WBW81_15495 [Methylocella sp.]
MREVAAETALMIGVMGLAGRRLLLAGRATGHHGTPWHQAGSIGPHAKAAPPRCENLHQERQQKYWKDRFKPAPQRFPPLFTSP